MKLLVFGASGSLGRAITQAALAAGHQVTAFVRSPGRLGSHARPREVTGDVPDAGSVAAAVPGHDAVISAFDADDLLTRDERQGKPWEATAEKPDVPRA